MKKTLILFTLLHFSTSSPLLWSDGLTARLNVASEGQESNADAFLTATGLSGDGRYVAFASEATNLVPDDTNNVFDVFVYDRWLGQLSRVSVSDEGKPGNQNSSMPAISADGRYVAFSSSATNLVPNDNNKVADIFVYDRSLQKIVRVSVNPQGPESNAPAFNPILSKDGRYVAFESEATNLVMDDTNNVSDIFVYDTQTQGLQRVSISSTGVAGNGASFAAALSSDGNAVAFDSVATKLSPQDTNLFSDVFVHDLQTGQTTLASVASSGEIGNGNSFAPSLSSDGRYVVFESDATNLVSNDTNGTTDVFIRNLSFQETALVSITAEGEIGNADSFLPTISADGQAVTFLSFASNLISNDSNGVLDVFLSNRVTGQITRMNIDALGRESEFGLFHNLPVAVSMDGCYTAFTSSATNLVRGDTNGHFDVFARGNVTRRASFDFTTLVLDLPVVQVPGFGNFNASLSVIPDSNFRFRLTGASPITDQNTSCIYFSFASGLLHLPLVEAIDTAGKITTYEVVMGLVPNSEPLEFELVKVTPK
jgi:Tol biopolymer transport system component